MEHKYSRLKFVPVFILFQSSNEAWNKLLFQSSGTMLQFVPVFNLFQSSIFSKFDFILFLNIILHFIFSFWNLWKVILILNLWILILKYMNSHFIFKFHFFLILEIMKCHIIIFSFYFFILKFMNSFFILFLFYFFIYFF